jgi:hypothetical protein
MKFKISLSKLRDGRLMSKSELDCGCAVGQALIQMGVPVKRLAGENVLRRLFQRKTSSSLLKKLIQAKFLYQTETIDVDQALIPYLEPHWVSQAYMASDTLCWLRDGYKVNKAKSVDTEKKKMVAAFKKGGHTITFVK